jgi:glycosyltransferase involved in cell wall biosynthesis
MKKIIFLFNHMTGSNFASGGDVFGKEILDRAISDKDFECSVSAPYYTKVSFPQVPFHSVGCTRIERGVFNAARVSSYPFAYVLRTIECIKLLSSLELDVLYTPGDFICDTIPAFFAKLSNKNIKWGACIFHTIEFPVKRNIDFLRGFVSWVFQRISFFAIKARADVIFVLTDIARDALLARGFKNKIVVTGAGLHVAEIKECLQDLNKGNKENFERKDLVFFSRVNKSKGVFDLPSILAEVVKKHPQIKLHVIGACRPRTLADLKKDFSDHGCLANVVFHGYIESKKGVYRILFGSRVVLQPSKEEGWGIGLFEAVLCGCLPVVYDLPVYAALFGKLIPAAIPGNTFGFSEKVLEALVLNKREFKKKVRPLYAIAKMYDWSSVYGLHKKHL